MMSDHLTGALGLAIVGMLRVRLGSAQRRLSSCGTPASGFE